MRRFITLGDRQFSIIASLIPVTANLALTPVLTRTLGTTEYGLWVTSAERDAMTAVLTGCPGQALPQRSDVALGSDAG